MAAQWVFFVTWDSDLNEWSADLAKDRRISGPLPVVVQRIGEAGWQVISAVPQRTKLKTTDTQSWNDVVSYAVFAMKNDS